MSRRTTGREQGVPPFRGTADWIGYAATPTFAAMSVLTVIFGGDAPGCSVIQPGLSLSGMAPMYLLMSLFHAVPWLRFASGLGQ